MHLKFIQNNVKCARTMSSFLILLLRDRSVNCQDQDVDFGLMILLNQQIVRALLMTPLIFLCNFTTRTRTDNLLRSVVESCYLFPASVRLVFLINFDNLK